MRELKFESEAEMEYFKIIYEGLSMTQKQFTPKEVRRLDKLFTAFEVVGVKTGEKLGGAEFYKLKEPAVVQLEDADFELLKSAIEPPNVMWNGMGARKAGLALNWLDDIKGET